MRKKARGAPLPLSFAVDDKGILPDSMIERLAADGAILPSTDFQPDQIQPASLDLRLGEVAYRVRASFLPGSTTVAQRIDELKLHEFALTDGAVLETGCVYIVPLLESLALPDDISAAANPKSSTGRLDVFTRVIADEMRGFDRIEPGYHGPLYAEISPRTFPVLVREGSRLSQIRFRHGRAQLDAAALRELHARERLVDSDEADLGEGIAVGVDLSGVLGAGGIVGYRAKRHTGLIDVERRAGYSVLDFWEPMQARPDKSLILDPNEFYILASKEAVQVPPGYAAEMVPFDPLVGEFRVHYAGFFDPGFGYAGAGGKGSRAVLEVRSREVPFILEHGQIVGRLVYEKMLAMPDKLYGQGIGSNYQAQSLKLSKHFKA
jgi:dCTP deaminase